MEIEGRAAAIEAVKLSKRYDSGVLALDALDLRIRGGEIYGLLGANGAGKTTTIHLFLNFIEPTGGQALIRGIDVARDSLEARRHSAYVSENVMLYRSLTARQNLDFFARIAGAGALDRRRSSSILSEVGLGTGFFDRRVGEFSKGMRQKLGIAIAIVKDAPAIFLDEPTSGLDPTAGAEFMSLLRDLRSRDKAILMSTHDIFRAREIADRVGIMKGGHLLAELDRSDLEARDLEALYLSMMKEGTGTDPIPARPQAAASDGPLVADVKEVA